MGNKVQQTNTGQASGSYGGATGEAGQLGNWGNLYLNNANRMQSHALWLEEQSRRRRALRDA
jgi:hypothetical protein